MISRDRALEVAKSVEEIGIRQAAVDFNLSDESVGRYVRFARSLGDVRYNTKILTIDIETSPVVAAMWGIRKQYVSHTSIIRDWHLLTFAAKWLSNDDVVKHKLSVDEVRNEDDSRLCILAWDMLNEADIVIAHNGDRFDFKKLNSRFYKHNMIPPSSYQSIDTLKTAFSTFAHTSSKLDYLLNFKDMGGKTDNGGMSLWMSCIGHGETGCDYEIEKSMDEMLDYNVNDVVILEQHYLDVRPWIKNHPNLPLYDDINTERCKACGSDDIKWIGKAYTPANRYSEYRCNSCGHIGRSRNSELTPNKRKTLTR
jgi:rRNA maturation protein Nop10